MKRLLSLGLFVAMLVPRPGLASGSRASASGFVEVRGTANIGVDGAWWQLVERVRPTFEAELGSRVRLVSTVELSLSQGRDLNEELQRTLEESDFGPFLDLADCSWPTTANRVLRIDGADDYLDVDRLYLDIYLPSVDLRIGRQPLNWGSAALLNPTDPFPELLVAEPWRPRRGINAIRATFALGEDSDIAAVVATNDVFKAVRVAGRARTNLGIADLAISGAWRSDGGPQGDGLLGLDLKGTLGVGFWLEGAVHFRQGRIWEEVAVGIDYSFNLLDGMIVMAQYLRNGAPTDGATGLGSIGEQITTPDCDADIAAAAGESDNPLFGGSTDPNPFAPALGSKNYLMLSVSQRFLPELSLSLIALQNLDDGTGMFIPTLSAAPLGWLDISVSAQILWKLWGDGGEFRPAAEDLLLTEDLGTLGSLSADFTGLLPDATVTLWTRASF